MKRNNLSLRLLKPILINLSTLLLSLHVYAGTMGAALQCPGKNCTPYFVEIGSGVSYSYPTHIKANLDIWNTSPEGYNSAMGNAALYRGGVGYNVAPWLNFDFSGTYRGSYSYIKFQEADPTNIPNPLPARYRHFNFSSVAVMFNGTLEAQGISDKLILDMSTHGFIKPIIGAGIGASYNTVSNFHTILIPSNVATSVMQDSMKTSFAYQFNTGLEWVYERLSLDLAYRYFNGGNFHSNNYLSTRVDGNTLLPMTTIGIPAWTGQFAANELYLTAKVAF